MMSNRRIVSEQRTESNRDLGRRLAPCAIIVGDELERLRKERASLLEPQECVAQAYLASLNDDIQQLAYITKQRLPFSPEVEATHWHRRQPSERVVGVRFASAWTLRR